MSRHVVRWPMKVINGKKKKKEIPGMRWGGGHSFCSLGPVMLLYGSVLQGEGALCLCLG